MRIGFDGLTITARPAGVGGAAGELLVALAKAPGAPEIVAVLPLGSAIDARVAALPNVEIVRAPVPGPDTPRALYFQHRTLPRLLAERGCDALFAPSFVVPLLRATPPSVVFFHDAAWRRFPESKSAQFRAYMNAVVPRSCRRARVVATCSEFARREALDLVPDLDPARVVVVPLAARTLPAAADVPARLAALGIEGPFVLSVSNFAPRKNLDALVRAWRRLRTAAGVPHALVLVGDAGRAAELRRRSAIGAGEPVLTPGHVSDADLSALYSGADLVVIPSLYEGFGLPVLEAFQAGAPVACSNRASLPEVAGDAAVLFEPADDDEVADAIRSALQPGPEREARVLRGRERAASFSWTAAAERLLRLLRDV